MSKKIYASVLERVKAYQARHRERVLARNRAYFTANREECNARSKAWRDANREKFNASYKASYERNKEKCLARSRAWKDKHREELKAKEAAYYEKHPEKLSQKYRKYRKGHPEQVLASGAVRRARIHKGKVAKFTAAQLRERLSMFGGRCWMCGEVADQVDHVIALARGGAHILANLRPACGSCNRRKGAKQRTRSQSLIGA